MSDLVSKMDDDTVLEMVVATERIPPVKVLCKSEESNAIVCTLTDIATHRQRAQFKVKDDLKDQIPQLLQLYLK